MIYNKRVEKNGILDYRLNDINRKESWDDIDISIIIIMNFVLVFWID